MSDPIIRLNAALEGRYAIERELGEGGMATVFLADDLKHERKVALKVLKPELAAVVGAERFLAEIKTTANLQHPHILPLFDSGEADGFLFYVMPLVEGESLRDRLDRERQLPVDEAVRVVERVALALQYAHEQGVIHRDIKPENILLSRGEPLVVDFGIALAVQRAGAQRLTETGLSLGTPHYMSPEQATGDQVVDARSDVYSLGCTLYELLVGEPPFTGPTAQAILGRIITAEPEPVTSLRTTVPQHVDAVIATALEKLPADRFTTAEDFAEALSDPGFVRRTGAPAPSLTVTQGAWNRVTVAMTAMAVVMTLVAGWSFLRPRVPPTASVIRAEIPLPDSIPLALETWRPALTISRDGSKIAYVGSLRGVRSIYQRRLDGADPTLVEGTRGANSPFFDPDGERLGFVVAINLWAVPLTGGAPVLRSGTPPVSRGLSWARDGTIFVSSNPNSGINGISPDGLGPVYTTPGPNGLGSVYTTPNSAAGEYSHRWSSPLPGGEGVLYTIDTGGGFDAARVAVLDTRTGEQHVLIEGGTSPKYAASGHLLYARAGQLWAVPFDVDRLAVDVDAATIVVDGVLMEAGGVTHYDVSENGTLVYVSGTSMPPSRRLVWVSRDGSIDTIPLAPGAFLEPRVSPDGRSAMVIIPTGSNFDLWRVDFGRNNLFPITTHPGEDLGGAWSPDGRRYAFASESQLGRPGAGGGPQLHAITADGTGSPVPLAAEADPAEPVNRFPLGWTGGGDTILYASFRRRSGADSVAAYVLSDSSRVMLGPLPTQTIRIQRFPAVSADGRWFAYVSDETGREEVWIRPVHSVSPREQASLDGGAEPAWSRDGRELFFRQEDRMMSVPVSTSDGELDAGVPQELFRGRFSYFDPLFGPRSYDVAPDGRFLMVQSDAPRPTEIQVVVNFFEELRQRVPN